MVRKRFLTPKDYKGIKMTFERAKDFENFKNCLEKFNLPLTFEEYKKKFKEEPVLLIAHGDVDSPKNDDSLYYLNWRSLSKNGYHAKDGMGKRILFFLFKDCFYHIEGTYSWEEAKLLVFEDYDKERKKLERLKLLYASEEVKEDSRPRPPIPEAVRIAVWRRDGGKCVKCGSRKNLEYDHIIPLSKGGSNTVRNIELLCEKCNRKKRDNIE